MESSQIPPLTLPSGGTVEFVDLDDLTGADLHKMRRRYRVNEAGGESMNNLVEDMLPIAIKTWDIPYLADPRTPEANPAAWKKLKIRDMRAIEEALTPLFKIVFQDQPAADSGEPGSPPQPGSE